MNKNSLLLFFICILSSPLMAQFPASGGPDTYGYTWQTDQAAGGPTYNWEDITSIGTLVSGLTDDNVVGPFSLGFDFPYYWVTHTQVYIGSNGYLSFQNGNIASVDIGFPNIPTPSTPNDIIAPFLSDLNPNGALNPGKVYYYSDIANKRFIVSYVDMPFWNDATDFAGENTFQVILDGNDGTITFQYQKQQGNWDPAYNTSQNPMVVGIENVTGSIGLFIENRNKPVANSAVRLTRPSETTLEVIDVEPTNVQTEGEKGFFAPYNPRVGGAATFLRTDISNVGNVDLNGPVLVRGQVLNDQSVLVWQAQESVPNLGVGENFDLRFSIPFNPPAAGSYFFTVNTTTTGDQNFLNNTKITELVAVDTTLNDVTLSYNSGDFTKVAPSPPDTLLSGTVVAPDIGSGAGVRFTFFGFPLIIKALEYYIAGPAQVQSNTGFVAELYGASGDGSVPGQLLFRDTVELADLRNFNWNTVAVPQSQGVIADDEFYVSWISNNEQIGLIREPRLSGTPISRNSYEIIDGNWAQDRNNEDFDLWIRAIVDISNIAVITDVKDPIQQIDRFEIFPNPSNGIIKVVADFASRQQAKLVVRNMLGSKVYLNNLGTISNFQKELDLSRLPAGTYLVELHGEKGSTSKKIIIR